MKALIIKLGSIGDVVHALPAVAAFREALPEAELSWIVDRRSAEILRGSEVIDDLIEIDTRSTRKAGIERMLKEIKHRTNYLRAERFDTAIDMQGLLKSAFIAKLSGARVRFGFDKGSLREPASRFLLNRSVHIPPETHIILKNLLIAEAAAGVSLARSDLQFPISTAAEHIAEAEEIAANAGGRFAIVNPAGGWPTKLWPAENYGRLADLLYEELGLYTVVTVGPGEDNLAEKLVSAASRGKVTITKPSLKGFYELAKRASVYIGGDTGPTHLAVAAGAPVVGIFGPTEWWRNGSPFPDDIEVGRTDIICRVNCHRRRCSKWVCMEISPEKVLMAARKRIENGGKASWDILKASK